ncbi:MAG: type II toxin-antitoxin system YafQ family toxin [Treponema sp.]|nr:type II toxin-antitoxin system YafQ family toxin [Treponema sp.]
MYNIVYTNRMKRDAKLMQKRGKDLSAFENEIK